ncbi:MAG: alkyl hydroperoxide reductase/Thiol specific antioxidant/Mal allergen [Chloroflexi bacterium]|nr:alkyl hydroperoxide reductase/Thiol specific antioxidant/Mal allergen [Chloroflexota bacterium]
MKSSAPSARKQAGPGQALPLVLIGSGLILIGIMALVLLPKPQATAQKSSSTVYAIPVAVSFPAPEIRLSDLQGQSVTLSDHGGKVILVNNWATWCPPCKAEMPTLEGYYQDHQSQGFTIIAIEAGEPPEEVAEFARQYGLTFPVWPDPGLRALASFRNDALPSSYVIDRDGQVRLAWSGPISRELLEKFVTPLLEE